MAIQHDSWTNAVDIRGSIRIERIGHVRHLSIRMLSLKHARCLAFVRIEQSSHAEKLYLYFITVSSTFVELFWPSRRSTRRWKCCTMVVWEHTALARSYTETSRWRVSRPTRTEATNTGYIPFIHCLQRTYYLTKMIISSQHVLWFKVSDLSHNSVLSAINTSP